MKVYIRAAVSIDNLRTQYGQGMPEELFAQIVDLDPTADYDSNKGGKYCPWLFRQYKNKDLKRNDFTNVSDALAQYSKEYKKYPKTNILDYKSVEEFLTDTEAVGNRELTEKEKAKLLKRHAHAANDQDKELLVEDGTWQVWTPKTYAGSISLARMGGTKASWCTAYEGNDYHWNYYTSKGPLYIFINTADPNEKYQTHFETKAYMYDIHDNPKGERFFYEFCSQHPKIKELFDIKDENGLTTRANSIVSFTPGAEEIIIPEGITTIPNYTIPASCKRMVLPSTVHDIGDRVFINSSVEVLEFVHLDSVGFECFKNSAIREIDFTKIDNIKQEAFRNCQNLTSLNLNPNGKFGAYSFSDNNNIGGKLTILPTMDLSLGVFNDCPNLTLIWEDADGAYAIDGIKALVVDKSRCPNLVAENDGYITIIDRK